MEDLKELLPECYDSNVTMRELQDIISADANMLGDGITALVGEAFISTAAGTLSRREQLLGIPPNQGKDTRYRRERIRAKLLSQGTTTKALIKNISEQFTNGEVDVEEQADRYIIRIAFTGTVGIPPQLEDLKSALRAIIPAHLALAYEFVYNTHEVLGRHTHAALEVYTHQQLFDTRI